jgi:hypothetical protein
MDLRHSTGWVRLIRQAIAPLTALGLVAAGTFHLIVFEAPRFAGRPSPGSFTVFWNGIFAHDRQELAGATFAVMRPHEYTAHEPEARLQLQQHGNRVRFRNIWVRRLKGYDQPAAATP